MFNGDKHFFEAYVTCALWSTNDESTPSGGEPLDKNHDETDIAPETLTAMRKHCETFQATNGEVLEHYYEALPEGRDASGEWTPEAQAGHDFWLSRNGHGAGFFDRDVPAEIKDALQDSASAFGTYDLYIGDDGVIYGS